MSEISRIEVYCEDKLVGRIQRMLAGIGVIDIKSMPVTNAKFKNGKIQAKSSGDLLDMFVAWLAEHKIRAVSPKELQQFMKEAGRSAAAYQTLRAKAIDAKILKKTKGTSGKTVTYTVL